MIDWPTYNELRAAANDESLSYGELMLIQTAFDEVPDEQLSDQREYALADDMLDEIATFLSHGCQVFITDDGIVPTCDLCSGPQWAEGDDWNGETGNHHSCEEADPNSLMRYGGAMVKANPGQEATGPGGMEDR